jgi:phthiocerol/phenolphthiocerol synthesis type-I polyketide synthase E
VETELDDKTIAIVGLSCRLPGALSPAQFWDNLCHGVESVRFLTREEALARGLDPRLADDPSHVRAVACPDDIDRFDAAFFGVTHREAEIMDPQQRILLECAWEALEDAGCDAGSYRGAIGVFAGATTSTYLLYNLLANAELRASVDPLPLLVGNAVDSLATRIAYKLNLKGPSFTVQSACSTSLLAVHVAGQSLLNGECDLALAGGVSINVGLLAGYRYEEGSILSPDGHCRAFDARAAGTLFGSGAALVVLKRLEDATADGDFIYAVIRGSAVNNDGSAKIGYTAPSVEGQMAVIAQALAAAGVNPDTISYVEAHGTGTSLGDPVEIEALTRAYHTPSPRKDRCALGTVKTNIGHLDIASGVAGLVKTVLALRHRLLPPSLHFERPNPRIDFAAGPFYVSTALAEWKRGSAPRRAGVSSFGFGGTNVHMIVEEAPAPEPSSPSRPCQLLVLSARTAVALDLVSVRLAEHLEANPEIDLADVAFTLARGRRAFTHRRALVSERVAGAAAALRELAPGTLPAEAESQDLRDRAIAFLFPGQGAQHVGMGRGLYETEPAFRDEVGRCAEWLRRPLGLDLRGLLFPATGEADVAAERLNRPRFAQPALFAIEYALVRLLMGWGIRPRVMIGHSMGEYVAACVSGVLSLEDALTLVAARGRLIGSAAEGAMQADSPPDDEVRPWRGDGIDAAAHASHSAVTDPAREEFAREVGKVRLDRPQIPFVSNVTGRWITPAEAADPAYWVRHLWRTDRFSDGLRELLNQDDRVLLEVGPGQTLTSLARQHGASLALSTMRKGEDRLSDPAVLLDAVGRLWRTGQTIDWAAFYGNRRRKRVSLPTYPFEGERYWIEPRVHGTDSARPPEKNRDIASWFHVPVWKPSPRPRRVQADGPDGPWLLLLDDSRVGDALASRLRGEGRTVVTVRAGCFDPDRADRYRSLVAEAAPRHVVHLWSLTSDNATDTFAAAQAKGYLSLIHLARALADARGPSDVHVISNRVLAVASGEAVFPDKATLLGACKVIAQELEHLTCRYVDVNLPVPLEAVAAEITSGAAEPCVAYRGRRRWVPVLERVPLSPIGPGESAFRERGVYLVGGGIDGAGFPLLLHLARSRRARLAIVEDPVSRLGERRTSALEAAGAELLALPGTLAHVQGVREALDAATSRFGAVHGLIYAVRLPLADYLRPLAEADHPECLERLECQAQELAALREVLGGRPLDFCLVLSSLSSVLGGPGTVVNTARACLVDAHIGEAARAAGLPWLGVDADAWRVEGEVDTAAGALAAVAMEPAEGAEAVERLLASGLLGPVVVSTTDLSTRRTEPAHPREEAAVRHPRPALQSPYEPPFREVERRIARIWQEALGLERVGIDDNFFELGGDSFVAIQVISRLRAELKADVASASLYECLTVRALADLMERDESKDARERTNEVRWLEGKRERRKQFLETQHRKRRDAPSAVE